MDNAHDTNLHPHSGGGMFYALASSLVGFPSSTLRVKVLEVRDGVAFVITASLLDAGTRLVLDPSQIEREVDTVPVVRHRDGCLQMEVA